MFPHFIESLVGTEVIVTAPGTPVGFGVSDAVGLGVGFAVELGIGVAVGVGVVVELGIGVAVGLDVAVAIEPEGGGVAVGVGDV